jgi:hypothetical protein
MSVQTETGLPFLMPNKNKILKKKDLSIHFFRDGFYFCTQSKVEFIPSLQDPKDFHKILIDYLDYHSKESFNAFSLISFHNPSTFVPLPLFDKSFCKDYLGLYNRTKDHEIILYDTLEEDYQVNLYSFPRFISVALKESKFNFSFHHYNTLLHNKILTLGSSNKFDYQLFIHLQQGVMDVFLLQKKCIKFNNCFSVSNPDEFLYYLFFVIEQFDIQSEDFGLNFLGKFKCFTTYYKAVEQFHNNIKFVDKDVSKVADTSTHHAPYLSKHFS